MYHKQPGTHDTEGTSMDKVALNSEEIKLVATAIIELRLPEGIS